MAAKIRRAAVAGSWYPGTSTTLAAAIDRHLADTTRDLPGDLVALIAPHAGLYTGPVAAHAYRLLRGRQFDVAVLVGPSHFVGFEGVSVYPAGDSRRRSVWRRSTSVRRRLQQATPAVKGMRPPTPASTRSKCSSRFCSISRRACRSCRW
jgi:hypothetical protein